jgi:hypothetical protein
MVIMNQPILSILLFSLVMGLIVFVANMVLPPLVGRPRTTMPLIDLALLIAFIAIIIFILRALGWWAPFVAGI